MEIGWQGRLPWHLPNDLRHFKEITKGRTLVMGRATYNSMLDVNLADRVSFVLSRENYRYKKAYAAHSVVDALIKTNMSISSHLRSEVFIIGGVGPFREALPLVDRAYITIVEGKFQADRYFPVGLDYFYDWKCSGSETFFPDSQNPHQHTIYTFDRRKEDA